MDHLSTAERSVLMGRIANRDTAPEVRVRRLLHRLGFQFRRPIGAICQARPTSCFRGIVSPSLFMVASGTVIPAAVARLRQSRTLIAGQPNSKRSGTDQTACRELQALGWHVETIWECETTNEESRTAAPGSTQLSRGHDAAWRSNRSGASVRSRLDNRSRRALKDGAPEWYKLVMEACRDKISPNSPVNMLNCVDLFAGAGGFSLAAHSQAFGCGWQLRITRMRLQPIGITFVRGKPDLR